jgi:addiction module HigA family antidote
MPTNKMRMIHPGEILAEELVALDNISANQFAKYIGVPTNRVTGILNKQRAITADTALRLSKFFGTTAEFWLNLQDAYDIKFAQQKSGKQIEKEVLYFGDIAELKIAV